MKINHNQIENISESDIIILQAYRKGVFIYEGEFNDRQDY